MSESACKQRTQAGCSGHIKEQPLLIGQCAHSSRNPLLRELNERKARMFIPRSDSISIMSVFFGILADSYNAPNTKGPFPFTTLRGKLVVFVVFLPRVQG